MEVTVLFIHIFTFMHNAALQGVARGSSTDTHTCRSRGFSLGTMLLCSHLLNGVGIAVTSPGLAFPLVAHVVCVHEGAHVTSLLPLSNPPVRDWIMAPSESAKTLKEEGGGEELLPKSFTVTFPGGNKHFTVSVCNL